MPLQQQLDGPAKPRPEFDLPGNGAFHNLTREPGVEYQGIGKLHWLTHSHRVA